MQASYSVLSACFKKKNSVCRSFSLYWVFHDEHLDTSCFSADRKVSLYSALLSASTHSLHNHEQYAKCDYISACLTISTQQHLPK